MADVIIRRIEDTPEDVEKYRNVRLEMLADEPVAYSDTYEIAASRPKAFWAKRVGSGASGDDEVLLVAEQGKAFVGSFTANKRDDGSCWITGVWVHEQHRGSGLATAFLSRIDEWARAASCSRLKLHVNSINDRARRFYERSGFSITGNQMANPNFPGTMEIEMEKSLS